MVKRVRMPMGGEGGEDVAVVIVVVMDRVLAQKTVVCNGKIAKGRCLRRTPFFC